MKKSLEELNQLKASFDDVVKAYKTELETKGSQPTDTEKMIYEMVSYVHQRINRFQDDFYSYAYEHSRGHIPPIQDAGKMKECLKAIGLSESYEVRTPVVYANNKNGVTAEVNFIPKKV